MTSHIRPFVLKFSRLVCLLAACLCAAGIAAAQTDGLPTIENFFQDATFSGAKLSPNAKFAALRVATKISRADLIVLDLTTLKSTVVASFSERDIGDFRWVNDDRLVFNLTDLRLAPGDRFEAPGLYAVNRDGSQYKTLVDHTDSFVKLAKMGRALLPWNTFLSDTIGEQQTNDVLVIHPEAYDKGELDYISLQRLNTLTGKLTEVETPLHTSSHWMDKNGDVRIAITREKNLATLHHKDLISGKWVKLWEYDRYAGNSFHPVFYGDDDKLIVSAYNGKDKAALYRYDLTKKQLEPDALVSSPEFDIDAQIISAKGKLLGVRYEIDAQVTQWFDPKLASIQQTIDAMLPNTINRLSVAPRPEAPFFIVEAYSDTQPSLYFLFNAEAKKLTHLGSANRDIDPKKMSLKDMVRYKARDGLVIPAYLTLPTNSLKKNLPMVVLVHGGPWVRGGHWNWDADAQFLASRGYAVLEPEFRGSTGFGDKHFKAGWKQWGIAMQNDIADGTRWAIAQGIADPKRICIAGASYGGYATLMGLINDPDLYRCGINWVGVTDINLLYDVSWSDFSGIFKRYGMPEMIGDQIKDAAQLKATSPLENASKIKQALLLAYGSADQRVPLIHGEKFYAAVKKENPNVEWVVYDQEGHGWSLLKTRIDFWGRVEKFLDKNIGKP